jgi:hypothetical protein
MILLGVLTTVLPAWGRQAQENDLLPPRLPKEQRDHLLRFLQEHAKPDRYVPPDAKLVDATPAELDRVPAPPAGQAVKQYVVRIASHRPVADQEEPQRVDVYYYRPSPEKGKPGITVKHTVDLTTGKQVGPTEVMLKEHTPLSREELTEAMALAKEKVPALQALYQGREAAQVRYEYLQMRVQRKSEKQEPGDRVVRFVFMAEPLEGQAAPDPLPILVNLTKGTAEAQPR